LPTPTWARDCIDSQWAAYSANMSERQCHGTPGRRQRPAHQPPIRQRCVRDAAHEFNVCPSPGHDPSYINRYNHKLSDAVYTDRLATQRIHSQIFCRLQIPQFNKTFSICERSLPTPASMPRPYYDYPATPSCGRLTTNPGDSAPATTTGIAVFALNPSTPAPQPSSTPPAVPAMTTSTTRTITCTVQPAGSPLPAPGMVVIRLQPVPTLTSPPATTAAGMALAWTTASGVAVRSVGAWVRR
jgi:hypothetical protein